MDGVTYTLAYDEENRIETVTDTQSNQTWTFHYDGNGTRIRQVNPDNSQLLLLNGGRYHVEIAADTTISTTRYYSIAGQRPAMRNNDGSINYLLGDHLGSVSTVVDANGEIISQSRYLPFGEVLWEDGASPTDYSYTGQRSLSDIGLMDYNARFYDPLLGRFTSPDSIVPEPGNVIGYNRFAYVNNNPMIYTDPSGHHPCKVGDPDYNSQNCISYLSNSTSGTIETLVNTPFVSPNTDTITNILFTGNGGDPNLEGPNPNNQMGAWVGYYDGTQQYLGSNVCKNEYCAPYAKYRTSQEAYKKYSKEAMISLTCYSGGVEACIMFAKEYMRHGGKVYSMALIGGTYIAGDENGNRQEKDYWSGRVQNLVDRGVKVLVYDDVVNDPSNPDPNIEHHHGPLGVNAAKGNNIQGSYLEIESGRIHYSYEGDWASNRSSALAGTVSDWHKTLEFALLDSIESIR